MKKILWQFFLIGSSLGILIFFFIDQKTLKDIFSQKTWKGENPSMILWGILIFIATLMTKSLRFFMLCQKVIKKKMNNKEKIQMIRWFSFCYSLSYFFVGTGVVTKVVMLKKDYKVKPMTSVSLIAIEKIFSLTIILPIVFYIGNHWQQTRANETEIMEKFLLILFFLLTMMAFILFRNFRKKILLLCLGGSCILPKKLKKTFKKALCYTNMGLSTVDHFSSLMFFLMITLMIWLGEIGIFYTIFQFQNLDFTFVQSILFFCIVYSHVLLPVSGSLGTFEIGFIAAANILQHRGNIIPISVLIHTFLWSLHAFWCALSAISYGNAQKYKEYIKNTKKLLGKQ